jgi:hypothetical protein
MLDTLCILLGGTASPQEVSASSLKPSDSISIHTHLLQKPPKTSTLNLSFKITTISSPPGTSSSPNIFSVLPFAPLLIKNFPASHFVFAFFLFQLLIYVKTQKHPCEVRKSSAVTLNKTPSA